MKGQEIKDYLELSYDNWNNTIPSSAGRLLKIAERPDSRTGQKRWSFVNMSYNFDSAGGLVYEVDVTKPYGSRVNILSLADGSAFDAAREYNVAMTSYRASGGGGLMKDGAGIDTDHIGDRVVEYYPEIRNILYDYLKENKVISPEVIGDETVIGKWAFVPEKVADKAMQNDLKLLFPDIM